VTPFNRISILFRVLFLICLSAGPAFAALDQTNHSSSDVDAKARAEAPAPSLLDITHEYSRGVRLDFTCKTDSPSPRETLPDPSTGLFPKRFATPPAFTFYSTEQTAWSLSPLSDKFSLNPLDDIGNLEVLLRYSF
jgi:hypothetical protein